MIFHATLEQTADGEYVASCDTPAVQTSGLSPTNALDRLRDEIRYCLELCPCSGVDDDYVQLDVDS